MGYSSSDSSYDTDSSYETDSSSDSSSEFYSDSDSDSDSDSAYDPEIAARLPDDFDIQKNCDKAEACYRESGKTLGSGDKGSVRALCGEDTGCSMIIKEQSIDSEYVNEVEIMKHLTQLGYDRAPAILRSFTCRNKGLIIMERTYPCSKTPSRSEVMRLCDDLYKRTGILHMDNHAGNVMCTEDGKLVLIDFGMSLNRQKPQQVLLKDTWHDKKIGLPRLREGRVDDKIWEHLAWSFMMLKINQDEKFVGPAVSTVQGGPYDHPNSPLFGLKVDAPAPQEVMCIVFPEFDRKCFGRDANEIAELDKPDFDYPGWYRESGCFMPLKDSHVIKDTSDAIVNMILLEK